MSDDNPEDVGYGKPPERTRFVKGKSGNPTGRPKGSKNLASIVAAIGSQKIRVKVDGKMRIMTKAEASMAQLTNQAMSGKIPALQLLATLLKFSEDSPQTGAPASTATTDDLKVMEGIVRRIRAAEPAAAEGSREDDES